MLEVEIYYYHAAEPVSIPLPGYDQATAESYLERLKTDVIEAQRHGQNRLLISPFGRRTRRQSRHPRYSGLSLSAVRRSTMRPTEARLARRRREIGWGATGGGIVGETERPGAPAAC